MKKIALLSLLLLSIFLAGCELFNSLSSNEDSSDIPTTESASSYSDIPTTEVFSADDLTIMLSNDHLPPVDDEDIMTYEEAALIGSAMVFDLVELDFEDKVIIMHYIPIDSMWNNSRGFTYEYDEWLGFILASDNYSLYFYDRFILSGNMYFDEQMNPRIDELVFFIEFRINVTTGAVTLVNKPNKVTYVAAQYSHLARDAVNYGLVDENLNLSPTEIELAQERAEHYLAIFTGGIPLTLLYDPATHPFMITPIPFLQFTFTCDIDNYHSINLHYETLQLIGISSLEPWHNLYFSDSE
ncbi:MAG: hypothetical protein FWE07_02735 [Turicibacter sp.]|nr:hypothetical protein [Turicibacter sp.]